MSDFAATKDLWQAVLDSWERNHRILLNLLWAIPPEARDARATASSPSVVEMFAHMIYVRLVFVAEDAPEYAFPGSPRDWLAETRPDRLEAGLCSSALAVRRAVEGRLQEGRALDLHYDHPLLLLQHMIWHEGYHHGQIKLALKITGYGLQDALAGPLTWRVWTAKSPEPEQNSRVQAAASGQLPQRNPQ